MTTEYMHIEDDDFWGTPPQPPPPHVAIIVAERDQKESGGVPITEMIKHMLVTRASSDNPTGPEDGSAADFYAQYIMKMATGETTYAPSAPLPRLRYASLSEEAGGLGLLSLDQAGEFFGRPPRRARGASGSAAGTCGS